MTRQLDAVGKAAHHQVLTCLPPWMDNLSFAARWEGTLLTALPATGATYPTCNVYSLAIENSCCLKQETSTLDATGQNTPLCMTQMFFMLQQCGGLSLTCAVLSSKASI